jgi:hypothetical protein
MIRFLIVFFSGLSFVIPAAHASDRCERLRDKLVAETPNADFDYRRSIAAFEDLRGIIVRPMREKLKKIPPAEDAYWQLQPLIEKASKTLDCLDTEIHLKGDRPEYEVGLKLKKAGCRNDASGKFRSESEANTLRHWEKEHANLCANVDQIYLARLWKQLEDVKAIKAANEQKETPPVKQTDASLKNSPFCENIRKVSASAAALFKSITAEKLDKNFIEESKSLGLPQIKLSDIVDIDMYRTPISVSLDFLQEKPECEIWIGTARDITTRIVPNHYCRWTYEKIARKDLEQKADRLLNTVRGCYDNIAEKQSNLHRHLFVGDGAVAVEGDVYFGDGKPSSIYLHLLKSTPEEDEACTRYAIQEKTTDRQICMRRLAQ